MLAKIWVWKSKIFMIWKPCHINLVKRSSLALKYQCVTILDDSWKINISLLCSPVLENSLTEWTAMQSKIEMENWYLPCKSNDLYTKTLDHALYPPQARALCFSREGRKEGAHESINNLRGLNLTLLVVTYYHHHIMPQF